MSEAISVSTWRFEGIAVVSVESSVGESLITAIAEPAAAPDHGGMTAFQGSTSHQPPQQVSIGVGRRITGVYVFARKSKGRTKPCGTFICITSGASATP